MWIGILLRLFTPCIIIIIIINYCLLVVYLKLRHDDIHVSRVKQEKTETVTDELILPVKSRVKLL